MACLCACSVQARCVCHLSQAAPHLPDISVRLAGSASGHVLVNACAGDVSLASLGFPADIDRQVCAQLGLPSGPLRNASIGAAAPCCAASSCSLRSARVLGLGPCSCAWPAAPWPWCYTWTHVRVQADSVESLMGPSPCASLSAPRARRTSRCSAGEVAWHVPLSRLLWCPCRLISQPAGHATCEARVELTNTASPHQLCCSMSRNACVFPCLCHPT